MDAQLITAVSGFVTACAATMKAWLAYRLKLEQFRAAPTAAAPATATSKIEKSSSTLVRISRWSWQSYVLLFIAIGLVLISTIQLIHYGRRMAANLAVESAAAERWPRLVKEAQARRLPYIMPHVTLLTDLQKAQPPDRLRLRARAIYSIQPLRNFDLNTPVFTETYSFAPISDEQHWYGSEQELISTPAVYEVRFQGVADRPTTVVTGINAIIRRGTRQLGHDLSITMPLPSDAQLVSYPNDADYIGQLLLVIDSPDLGIEPLPKGAFRVDKAGSVTLSEEFSGAPASSRVGQRSICARWNNLTPGETVGIAVRVKS
jgi:hypothetical protein